MVLITGATGFIGLYTADAFIKAGKKVIACGRNSTAGQILKNMGAEFFQLDITDEHGFEHLPAEDIEGVVHLAGMLSVNSTADLEHDENAADYFRVNVLGTINVLEFCRKHGIRKILGAGSYSDVANVFGTKEITEDEPRNFSFTGDHAVYVISKNAANDVMEYYNQQHGFQCAWFRLPPVYGFGPHGTIFVDGKKYKSAVATFIDNAIACRDLEIWGDSKIQRDLIYVKDVARAYVQAMASPKTRGLYNMTGHLQVDLETQAKIIIEIFGDPAKSKIVHRPEKGLRSKSFFFSMEKAKQDFDFVPEYDFHAMMQDYKIEMESGRWQMFINSRKK